MLNSRGWTLSIGSKTSVGVGVAVGVLVDDGEALLRVRLGGGASGVTQGEADGDDVPAVLGHQAVDVGGVVRLGLAGHVLDLDAGGSPQQPAGPAHAEALNERSSMPPWSVTMHPRKAAAAALPEAEPSAAFSSGAEPQAASASAATAPTASKRVFIRSPYPIDEAPIRRQTTSEQDFTRGARGLLTIEPVARDTIRSRFARRRSPVAAPEVLRRRAPRAAGSPAQKTSCGTYSPQTSRSAVLTSPTVARAFRASFIG